MRRRQEAHNIGRGEGVLERLSEVNERRKVKLLDLSEYN